MTLAFALYSQHPKAFTLAAGYRFGQVLQCLAVWSGRLWADAYEYVALVEWWLTEKTQSTWKETAPSAGYSITNPKWTSL